MLRISCIAVSNIHKEKNPKVESVRCNAEGSAKK